MNLAAEQRLALATAPSRDLSEFLAFLRRRDPPDYTAAPIIGLVDLFCGCGGISLGVAEAARGMGYGLKVLHAVDIDADAIEVYRRNLPVCDGTGDFTAGVADVQQVVRDGSLAHDHVGPVVLVGGPPCQGNSDLNNHTRREDERNDLYLLMADAAELVRADVVVIENVPGVRNAHSKPVDRTLERLRSGLGLRASERVLDPVSLGLPQSRPRHVVLATRRGDPDAALARLDAWRPERLCGVLAAIHDLQDTEGSSAFHKTTNVAPKNRTRIDKLFEEDLYDLPNPDRPPCHQDGDHSYKSMYGRLFADQPAQTITTGFTSMGQGRFVHPTRRRMITPHEAARLQGFPDFFRFDRTTSARGVWQKLIGNAVPPRMAQALVAEALREIL